MHDIPTTPLPGSWLSSRLGVNPREIEQLRDSDFVVDAVRSAAA